MPTMANITVKNAANADVIYTATVPSAGDRVPARWIATAMSIIAGFRAVFTAVARDNGKQNARVVDLSYKFPITGTVNGVETQLAIVPITLSATLPTNVDAAKVADATVQFTNLAASALVREVFSSGYAPT